MAARELRGLSVSARPGEEAEHLIKRFSRKVREDGILREVYARRGYEKPSVSRRRKHLRAVVSQRRAEKMLDGCSKAGRSGT